MQPILNVTSSLIRYSVYGLFDTLLPRQITSCLHNWSIAPFAFVNSAVLLMLLPHKHQWTSSFALCYHSSCFFYVTWLCTWTDKKNPFSLLVSNLFHLLLLPCTNHYYGSNSWTKPQHTYTSFIPHYSMYEYNAPFVPANIDSKKTSSLIQASVWEKNLWYTLLLTTSL